MKVTHLISGLRGGGAEHMVLELCRLSAKDPGMQMEVVTLSNVREIAWKFEKAGINVWIPEPSPFKWLTFLKALRHVAGLKPALVHSHMFHACMAGCLISIFSPRTKHVFTLHNAIQRGFVYRMLLFFSKKLRDVDVSFPGIKSKWYLKKNTVTIPNGIRVTAFNNSRVSKDTVFTILYAGRLDSQKNPLMVVDLAEKLKSRIDFRILVAGEGELETELKERINSRGLCRYISLLGFRNDIPELLQSSHCLILPSNWEGMPLVMLEAGSAGLPVVATPAANSTGILNLENSYLCEPDDFHHSVIHIAEHPAVAREKAIKLSQLVAEKFGIGQSYQQHKLLYRSL